MGVMSKVGIVYWSGTGNTERMAELIAEGAKKAGAQVDILTATEFDASKVKDYTAIAFGCSAMGSEQLEEGEFEPMWEEVKNLLQGKKVVLFGSYGWGDGEWMRNWKETAPCPIESTLICNEMPDGTGEVACRQLGEKLVRD